MGNTILTPNVIANEALMVLRNNAVMSNLVYRDYSDTFASVGDTITVRKPTTFTANEYTSAISVQNATESAVTVKMDKHLDVSFAVTSKELTLDISDFSKQLLVPAMQAFADKIDGYLLGLQASITNRVTSTGARADMIAARKYLTENAAPLTERYYVFNAETEADLLSTDLFVAANQVGDTDTLRDASLGRKFGLDCFVDQNLAESAATSDPKAIAFHRNAFALVTRPLAQPQGAANSAIVNYDGYALRVVYGYDMDKKTDTVSIDMLCGVQILDAKLAAIVQR